MSDGTPPSEPPAKKGFSLSFGIKDLIGLLEKIPGWARIKDAPTRIDELEKRVATLEERPHLPIWQRCGIGFNRLDRTELPGGPFSVFEQTGLQINVYRCDHCGLETRRDNTKP